MALKKYDYYYNLEEDTDMTWEQLPGYLQHKLDKDKLWTILSYEYEFLVTLGVYPEGREEEYVCRGPIDIDIEVLKHYIIGNAIEDNIYVSYAELDIILEAEQKYLNYKLNISEVEFYLN